MPKPKKEWQRLAVGDLFRNHQNPPYSWDEIEPWLAAKVERPEWATDPAVCTSCGQEMQWIDWSSPPMTWESLCGRKGPVPVCETCRSWKPLVHCLMS